jgi:asparagine synthase (glutamine-hydrolysing)
VSPNAASPDAAEQLWRQAARACSCLSVGESGGPVKSDIRDTCLIAYADPDPNDVIDDHSGRIAIRLGRAARMAEGDVSTDQLAGMIDRNIDLTSIVPPFAAAYRQNAASKLTVAGDWLGLRQLYLWRGDGVAAVSTSARALAVLAGGEVDAAGLGAQALIGWQIGDSTIFRGVAVLPPAAIVSLQEGAATVRQYASSASVEAPTPPKLDDAVDEMAVILRSWLSSYVEDHRDSVLQLTGGHDSRILLAAIPSQAREGLHTLTLGDPSSPDVRIAANLSRRYRMNHQVVELSPDLWPEPAHAHRLLIASAHELDCMASPLALAPLLLAERGLEQGRRLSGLGGEVARGFYYAGNPRDATTSPHLVERLARWRIFANESVEPEALDPDFYASAQATTLEALCGLFPAGNWLRATDHFYLFQRMHRWSGTHSSVAAVRRHFINPMFDHRFIELALGVAPADKRDSILLGRLTARLDNELARIPLDTGLSPAGLGHPTPFTRIATSASTTRKVVHKIGQRLRHGRRPQLGAEHASAVALQYWRADRSSCAALYDAPYLRAQWLDEVLDGQRDPSATTVAFLVNIVAAAQG